MDFTSTRRPLASASIAESSLFPAGIVDQLSATVQNPIVARPARPLPKPSGLTSRKIVLTFADRKTLSGCNAGESAIPVTGAKRDRHDQMRYKILPPWKSHKISQLRLMR